SHGPLPGPHRHNWLNADGQGVDARRHVAFRSGSPKNLRKFPRRSFSRERSPTSTGGPRACYRRRGKLSDGGSSLSTRVGTASSASALEVRGLLRSIGRNKLFSHPPIPGFVTGNWLNLALPCWIALSWKWISFQLTCFTLLVTGRNPFGGTLGNDGDPAGPAQGRAVLAFPGPVGPLAFWRALCWGPFHLLGQRSVHEVGATQRNGSITCFSRQEGWTYFCPKRKKCETRHWMPGPVRIGSDSLTTV
ncbi:hypothetical protein THAOC_34365, partial [Thalassiosira oceanica]